MGYPDWYEGSRGGEGPRGSVKPRKTTRFAANVQSNKSTSVMDTPLEEVEVNPESGGSNVVDSNVIQALAQEMIRLMKGK